MVITLLGEEIWEQSNGEVNASVPTVSTSHSIHVVAKSPFNHNCNIKIFAVEPDESAVLSGRPSG